jgi:hypothetical protein
VADWGEAVGSTSPEEAGPASSDGAADDVGEPDGDTVALRDAVGAVGVGTAAPVGRAEAGALAGTADGVGLAAARAGADTGPPEGGATSVAGGDVGGRDATGAGAVGGAETRPMPTAAAAVIASAATAVNTFRPTVVRAETRTPARAGAARPDGGGPMTSRSSGDG